MLLSCDYFSEPTATYGLSAYGGPVRVFDREQIHELLHKAESHGLTCTSGVDLECSERIISWKRLNLAFTFLLLAFRKQGLQ